MILPAIGTEWAAPSTSRIFRMRTSFYAPQDQSYLDKLQGFLRQNDSVIKAEAMRIGDDSVTVSLQVEANSWQQAQKKANNALDKALSDSDTANGLDDKKLGLSSELSLV